ncbi:hypothetical protein BD309DRAFT_691500 [Dichomitus squalens]|nr:hypothetical protein BD309DRAFT_691500 [Dichomitus squalens]
MEQACRAHLGKYRIRANALQPLRFLSGSQMVCVRVVYALATFESSPHLLVLDEVTHHLDYLTTEALSKVEAVIKDNSTAHVVSHDQSFVSKAAEQVSETRPEVTSILFCDVDWMRAHQSH